MSVTSGFFNSLNGDRRYNAEQLSAIFDGVINDGVFASVGVAFTVNADSGNTITVGVGRGWFNSTWIYNDGLLPITLDISETLLDRYDAVVIEINRTESVRSGSIKIVKGTPSISPPYPTMANDDYVHQYPLAYVRRKAGSANITQADITNAVGTSACPYVTGILQVQNIDNIVAQWMAEWDLWMEQQESAFDTWFSTIRGVLDGDIATALTDRILRIEDGTTPIAKATDADTLDGRHYDYFLAHDGSKQGYNPVSDLNDFYTGVGLFRNVTNGPGEEWILVISSGLQGTVSQVSIDLNNRGSVKTRHCAAGEWGGWGNLNTGCLPLSGGIVDTINATRINTKKILALREDSVSEGGQIELEYPATAEVKHNRVIDALAEQIRMFENGGTFRGAYLDFAECGAAVSSKFLHSGNSAFVKIQESAPSETNALWVW